MNSTVDEDYQLGAAKNIFDMYSIRPSNRIAGLWSLRVFNLPEC